MTELLWLAAFAAASYGIGNTALSIAKVKFGNFGEEAAFSFATGMVLLAYATLFLGLLGILNPIHYKIAFVAVTLLSYGKLSKLLSNLLKTAKSGYNQRQKLNGLLALILITVAILNLIAALAPVHASDAAAYHVATAKIYANEGRITFIPFMATSAYPMITEMLFLDGYLLGGGKTSELIAAFIAILAALAIYTFAKKHFGHTTALLAAAAFYTMPLVSVFNIRGFVDISAALYGMLSVAALLNWHNDKDAKMLVLAGIFAGAAASTKISAYPIAAVMLLAVVYTAFIIKRQRGFKFVKTAATYAIPAAIVVVPWLTRAYDYTGNPFYPLLTNVFGGPYLPHWLAQFWVDSLSFIGFGTGLPALLKLPWNITMHSTAFGEQLGIGPVFLAFIPLLLLAKADRKVIGIIAIAIPLILVWFYTAQSLRYMFFVYALLSVGAAYSITRLLAAGEKTRVVIIAAVAATMLINAAFWIGANNDELKVVAGLTEEDSYLESTMPNYGLLKFANNNLHGAKLCLYGEIRGYYSNNEYVWCHPLFQAYIDFYTTESSDAILARMKEAGITHILAEKNIQTFRQYSPIPASKAVIENANRIITEITENHAVKVYENSEGAIYRIEYG